MKKNSIILSLAFAAITGITLSSCEKESLQPFVKNNKVSTTQQTVPQKDKTTVNDPGQPGSDNTFLMERGKKIKTPMEQPKANLASEDLPMVAEK
jgi:hypothetical protein